MFTTLGRTSRHLVLTTAVAAAFGAAQLGAYAPSGHTWATTQVRYYINPANIFMADADAVNAIQSAASQWYAQSGANIQFVYAGYTSGSALTINNKNEVFFRDGSNGGFAGETYFWWDAN